MVRIGLSEQDAELFTSIAAYHIDLPELLVKQRRNLAQHLVSQHMSELVIEPLELIDVGHDDGHTGAVAAGALNLFHETQLEEAPVKNAGQTVEVGQLLHTFDIVSVLN